MSTPGQASSMRMMFSPSTLSFYAQSKLADYKAAGILPNDLVPVTDAVWQQYISAPPMGQKLGVSSGLPAWVSS